MQRLKTLLLLFFLFTSFCFSQNQFDSESGIVVAWGAVLFSEKIVVLENDSRKSQIADKSVKKIRHSSARKKIKVAAESLKKESKNSFQKRNEKPKSVLFPDRGNVHYFSLLQSDLSAGLASNNHTLGSISIAEVESYSTKIQISSSTSKYRSSEILKQFSERFSVRPPPFSGC